MKRMAPNNKLQAVTKGLMKDFDFALITDMMAAIKWQWIDSDGKEYVPSLTEIRQFVRQQIFRCYEDLLKEPFIDGRREWSRSAGGFNVSLFEVKLDDIREDDEETELVGQLQFVLVESKYSTYAN